MYGNKLNEVEQRYYVKLFDHEDGYLNVGTDDGIKKILDCVNTSLLKTEFTEGEIKEMDPRYWQFAIPVEDDCE